MKNTIDKLEKILFQQHIALFEGERKTKYRENTEDHDERWLALNYSYSKSHAFVIDSRASNHMVASRESLSSLQLTDGLSIHMGDNT